MLDTSEPLGNALRAIGNLDATRRCLLCGEQYTQRTGHDYDDCVARLIRREGDVQSLLAGLTVSLRAATDLQAKQRRGEINSEYEFSPVYAGAVEAEDGDKYFLRGSWETEFRQVTKQEFISAEGAAGFRSKFGIGHVATGGFSNGSVEGRVETA